VCLDIVLPDRRFDAIVPGYDRQLLAGILTARRTTPLVLALTVLLLLSTFLESGGFSSSLLLDLLVLSLPMLL
jgi:hypothetical protein